MSTSVERLRPITAEELRQQWGEAILPHLENPGCAGIVVYECQDLCSSSLGQQKAIGFGPDPKYSSKTAAECLENFPRLDTQLASTQKWPTYLWQREASPPASPAPAGPTA